MATKKQVSVQDKSSSLYLYGDVRDFYDVETIAKFFASMGGLDQPASKVDSWWKQWDRTHVDWAKQYNYA